MHYLEYIPVIWIVVTHLVLGNGLCYCALLLACYIVSVEQELYYRQHSMACVLTKAVDNQFNLKVYSILTAAFLHNSIDSIILELYRAHTSHVHCTSACIN